VETGEIISLIISGVSAIAAIISAISALKSKRECSEIKLNQKIEKNEGINVGINSGKINEKRK